MPFDLTYGEGSGVGVLGEIPHPSGFVRLPVGLILRVDDGLPFLGLS